MTIQEMQEEIERLKKELSDAQSTLKEAQTALRKEKREKFKCSDRIREKHGMLREQYHNKPNIYGDDVRDDTYCFIDSDGITALSRVVRNAMFVHIEDIINGFGKNVGRKACRYAKPFSEMTYEEYEKYENCMDEILGILETYDKYYREIEKSRSAQVGKELNKFRVELTPMQLPNEN